ncbi:MAG: hypothetical protein JWN34_2801, partial [Bryobacterales bacterium]|nr:hypothetical protein [Bryobacterales bacterium]
MTALTGKSPKNTYKDLLQVSNTNSGIDGTLRPVEDGEGTQSPLQISSTAVNIQSGFKLGGLDVSVSGTALLTAVDTAAQRTALGLGDAATHSASDFDSAGTASSAVTAHVNASDPHSQYLTATRGNALYDAIGAGTSAANSAVSTHVAASNPHAQYITQSAADGRYLLLGVLAEGAYLSTMSPAFTGTQNATALTADLTAAAGKRIVVPPGDYTLNAVNVSSLTIKLHFVPGARIIPDGSGGLYRVGTMIHFTNCTVEMENFFSDGQTNGSPICFRQDNGTLSARNTKIINFGPKTGLASTVGVYGFFLKGVTDARIDGWTSSGINDVRNSGTGITNAYGDQPGTTRHILFYNCGHYHLTNAFLTSGDELLGDDNDFIQFLDDQATVTMNGTIENVTMRYNGSARRCLKYQGGYHFADHIDIRKDSTFNAVVNSTAVTGAANNGSGLIRLAVASTTNIITGNKVTVSGVTGTTEANGTWTVTLIDGTHLDLQGSTFTNAYVSGGAANALTDVGNNNLNCVDWASASVGFLRLTNSYIDATGFAVGFGNTGGQGGQATARNVKLIGSQLNAIRHNLEHDADENIATIGIYTTAGGTGNTGDYGSGMDNCEIVGWVKGSTPQGEGTFFTGCIWDDPRDSVFETGNTGKTGFDFIGNKVITRTPGNLSVNTRCARLNDVRGVRLKNNVLEERGNTTHATTFIGILSASATGQSSSNEAPSGTTPVSVGSSAVVNQLSNGVAVLPSINSNTVLANITGSSAAPSGSTLSAILDALLGSTRGALITRGSTGWTLLAPHAIAGYVITSNGAGADPTYQAAGAASGVNSGTFATKPASPTQGQQYFATDLGTNGVLLIYSGSLWKPSSGSAVIFQTGAPATPTSSTSEALLGSISIPAGLLSANGQLRVTTLLAATGTTNTKTARLRFGTSSGVSGTVLGTYTLSAANLSQMVVKPIQNANSLSAQVSSASINSGSGAASTADATSAINTANATVINLTGQVTNAADTLSYDA